MNVTFEKSDALNGTISVSITSSDYLPSYEKKIKDYQKNANIPGFRAGHAPKSMIEKMYGNGILLEEVNGVAGKALYDYLETNKIEILGQPIISDDTAIETFTNQSDYTFKFEIGLAPEFELNISSADVFPKYSVLIDQKMVDDELDRMRKRFGSLNVVESAEVGDLVYASFTELDENGEILEGGINKENVPFSIEVITNEELKNQLVGIKNGAEMTVDMFSLFNNNETEISYAFGIQAMGVKDLNPNFKIVVSEIKRTELAEFNQEFFDKVYGPDVVKSEEELSAKIRTELFAYFESQSDHLIEHELFDTLVAKHNIELPEAFLKRWLMQNHKDKFTNENLEEAFKPEASYLRSHLLEEKILKTAEIKIDEQDIKAAAIEQTMQMFGSYNMGNISAELMDSLIEPQLKKDEYRGRMINIAARKKVNQYIKNTVSFDLKEVGVEEFYKVVAEHNQHHHHNHDHSEGHDHHDHENEGETATA